MLDAPDRVYLELPVRLTVQWAAALTLPPSVPVLLWCGDVQHACPLAVHVLAAKLAGRRVGFLRLDVIDVDWGLDLLRLMAKHDLGAGRAQP